MTTIDDSRRHCASCERIVRDFTKMSDAELVAFFASNKKFCGQFSEAQLNRELIPQPPKHNRKFTWLLPALLFGAPAFAQTVQPHPVQHAQPKQKKTAQPALLTIEGKVCDQVTGIPLPFANITLHTSGDSLKLTTDAYGNFCATFPRHAGDSVEIGVLLPGYSSYSEKVSVTDGYVFCAARMERIEERAIEIKPALHYLGAPDVQVIEVAQPRHWFFYRIFHWRKIRKAKKNYLE